MTENQAEVSIDLQKLQAELAEEVRADLEADIELIEIGQSFPSTIYADKPKWVVMDDVVAVFGDLRNSTGLNVDRHAKSTARIYEAATGGMVQTLSAFQPSFIDIQGDGAFGLFTGERRYERALCAAVTLRTFSEHTLVPELHRRLPSKPPETGVKVGVSAGRLLVKRIGVRGGNEPVWAGRPVNFAAKCAQAAGTHEVVITPKVYDRIKGNDYLSWSCGCNTVAGTWSPVWHPVRVDTLPSDVGDCYKLVASGWCENHGAEFCEAILSGKTARARGAA